MLLGNLNDKHTNMYTKLSCRFDALDLIENIVEKLPAQEMRKKQLKESIQVIMSKCVE